MRYDTSALVESVLSAEAQPHTPIAGAQPSKVTSAGDTYFRNCVVPDKYYSFLVRRPHDTYRRRERWKQFHAAIPRPKFHDARKAPWNQK
jgi:hypothetical protein